MDESEIWKRPVGETDGSAAAGRNAHPVGVRSRLQGLYVAIVLVSSCAAPTTPRPFTEPLSGDTVTLLDHGWHTDIGIPAEELSGQLAVFREIFPGARSLVFSYGKRTFLMAPANNWSEYVLGPLPGPAAIMVTGLSVPSEQAYGADPSLVFHLPRGGAAHLSNFIWRDIVHDQPGKPRLIDRGPFDGSLFYAAVNGYALNHTCNAWSASALAAAGLEIDPAGVIFARQTMTRARSASASMTSAPPR
jgi:hypothetical protein